MANFQLEVENEDAVDRDIGFWVGLGPDGSWESVRSLLPLSVVPKSLLNDFFAMEVVMKGGKKHAIFRGLATVVNDSDIKLDISISSVSLPHGSEHSQHTSGSNTVVEELFENQCFQPISTGGNRWSGSCRDEPAWWSTRDFSYSSKVRKFAN